MMFAVLMSCALQATNELYEAVRNKDHKEVLKLLQAGVNPNGDEKDKVPLVLAVEKLYVNIAKDLLLYKADVNYEQIIKRKGRFGGSVTSYIYSPLYEATRGNILNVSLIKLLLENGANPNIQYGGDHDTFLHLVLWFIIRYKHVDLQGYVSKDDIYKIVQLALKHGANLNIESENGTVLDRVKVFKELAPEYPVLEEYYNVFMQAIEDWQVQQKGKSIKHVAQRMAKETIVPKEQQSPYMVDFKFE